MALEQNPFGIEKLSDAQELVEVENASAIQANFDFYYGDHWQNGDAWSGPIPSTNESDYDTVAAEIERGLATKNVVKEIVDRAANAVTGRKPVWDVKPKRAITDESPITEEEQARIDEAKNLLDNWIEEKEFDKYISKALRQTLLAGKSTLRLFIPAGFVVNGTVSVDTERPLLNLYLDAPHPLAGAVTVDPNSREKVAVFLGKMGDEDTAEVSFLLPVATENGRVTNTSLIVGNSEIPDVSDVQLDLGGRLPVCQLEMPRLVTEQVVAMQKAINLNLTMMQRNSVLGGFLERVILGGQLPGHYEEGEDGQAVFVRDEFVTGAGTVNSISGIPIINEATGQVVNYTTPDMRYRDPVSPDTFLSAAESLYRMVLESSDQLHALISGDAAASGESRRQAVASFFAYLRTPKQEIDKAGRWTLETVLAFAGFLTGDASKFNDLRVSFESKLDMGAVPTAEIDLTERLVKTGIMSLETAREKVGIEDPEAEKRRVESEKGELAEFSKVNSDGTSKVTGVDLPNIDNNDITDN
jgi:hypothetical protein